MTENVLNIGLIGLGQRGSLMLEDVLVYREDLRVAALCDVYEDRIAGCVETLKKAGKPVPVTTKDYHEILADPKIDAVFVMTPWDSHIRIACEAMEVGKKCGFEVGGSYSLDDCWKLVRTYEKTGVMCAMLENCCYGHNEMLVLNMVRNGMFGEVVHCSGGYRHDLRDEITRGRENRHYRFHNYLGRNGDNYPTHDLGPIMNILDINHGNRILSLVSMASKSRGLHEFILQDKGPDYDAASFDFKQGDVVTTMLKCANGELITLTLDTCLPRSYSRGFHVQGTKAIFEEDNKSILMDGETEEVKYNWQPHWGNVEEYREYDHPVWKEYLKNGVKGGHGGADWLEISAFVQGCRKNVPAPLDVYDAATLMAVTALSEESIALGSSPVFMPDFTNGQWMYRKPWEPYV